VAPRIETDLFREGIELYNRGRFFDAHEALEELWRPEKGERRFFLQSLIHFAVAFHHYEQGNFAGAERQLSKGLRKLAGYLPNYQGTHTRALYDEGLNTLACIRQRRAVHRFPRIGIGTVPG
jgi:predicted metal-dependent hydrolase